MSVWISLLVLAGWIGIRGVSDYSGEMVLLYDSEQLQEKQITKFWADHMEEKSGLEDITLYKEIGWQTVENQVLVRKAEAILVVAAGNMNPIYPGCLEKGNFITGYDENGCVVSEGLADTLFGSRHAVGQKIWYGENEYVVRGVLGLKEKVMMIRGGEGTGYSRIWLSHRGESASAARQELSGILPEEEDVQIEGDFYVLIARAALVIPAILAFVLGIRGFCGWGKRRIKAEWKMWILEGMCFLCTIGGIYVLISKGLYYTDDYLPPAWSDFSFWGELWEEKAGKVQAMLRRGIGYREKRMLWMLASAIGSGIGITGTLIWSGIKRKM